MRIEEISFELCLLPGGHTSLLFDTQDYLVGLQADVESRKSTKEVVTSQGAK